jgi:hypothetical protein
MPNARRLGAPLCVQTRAPKSRGIQQPRAGHVAWTWPRPRAVPLGLRNLHSQSVQGLHTSYKAARQTGAHVEVVPPESHSRPSGAVERGRAYSHPYDAQWRQKPGRDHQQAAAPARLTGGARASTPLGLPTGVSLALPYDTLLTSRRGATRWRCRTRSHRARRRIRAWAPAGEDSRKGPGPRVERASGGPLRRDARRRRE